jgi:phosphoglycerate dehydrogenase-like enzyme
MRIFFYLPSGTIARCFKPEHIERLRGQNELVFARERATPQAWAMHAPEAEAIVTGWGTPAITDEQLADAANLRVLVHSAGSARYLIPPLFWRRPLRLATCNEALGIGVAETTLGMIVAGLKGFFPCAVSTRNGKWSTSPSFNVGGFVVRELYEVTIGIIGASKIGRHLIRLLKNFEVQVLLYDPYITQEEASDLGVQKVELEQLMSQSDVVSLHAPAMPSTRHMLGREQFAAMKDGAIFINTARGMIVEESSLIAELKTGRIFAFIDVTDPEPPADDHPFRKLSNCVLTPHIAGAVTNGCLRQGRSVIDQLQEFIRGQVMHGEVTAERFKIMA